MVNFLKKKKESGPPDIGKEEVEGNAENSENSEDNHFDIPMKESGEEIPNHFSKNKRKDRTPPLPQQSYEEKNDFDLEKINARLELINSLVKSFNERFSMINQQIGEIRAMTVANEKNLSISNLDARKTVDIVKEVNPERLRLDYQKVDFKVTTLATRIDSYKQYMESIMEELKDLKRRANLFEGTDALLKLNEDVKKDLIQIQKVNSRVRMNADKSEQLFIELSKGFRENQKINELITTLDTSYSELKKEMEKLALDYEQVLSLDDFDNFKKNMGNKLAIIEHGVLEIEGMKEENQKLSKAVGKLLLMEKRNEEDIASIGFDKGSSNIKKMEDYEQKLFSLLEIMEKLTFEVEKIKDRLGIKPQFENIKSPVPTAETEEENTSEIPKVETEKEKKIEELLSQGKTHMKNNDFTQAWELYKQIFDLYDPTEDSEQVLYSKIISFYETLSELMNEQSETPPLEDKNQEEVPSIEQRRYKQLSDY